MDARKKLTDLLAKLDGNNRLEELLQTVISSTEQLNLKQSEEG